MPTIADHLERAAEELARPTTTPTPEALRQVSERRRRRRRRNTVVGAAAIGTIAAAGIASFRPSPTQHVEAVDTAETTPTTNAQPPTTSTSSTSSEPDDDLVSWVATQPWVDRTFLVPPDAEILGFGHDNSAWDLARAPTPGTFVRSTTDPSTALVIAVLAEGEVVPASEVLAASWTIDLEERQISGVDGAAVTVRVRTTETGSGFDVRRPVEAGELVVQGVGLTETDAIELLLSVETEGTVLLLDDLPSGLEAVERARPASGVEYAVTFETSPQEAYTLSRFDRSLSEVLLMRTADPDGQSDSVVVRGVTGFVQPGTVASDPSDLPVLIWEEPGVGVFTLEAAWAPRPTADELVALAETLRITSYEDVIDRLDDPTGFFEQRPETITGWLEATPLPEGWDPRPLIATAPMDHLDTAGLVSDYTHCAWLSEFRSAVTSADDLARAEALEVLSRWQTWPATHAWMEERLAAASDPERMGTDIVSSREDHLSALEAVTDAADLESPEIADCGFVPPADR